MPLVLPSAPVSSGPSDVAWHPPAPALSPPLAHAQPQLHQQQQPQQQVAAALDGELEEPIPLLDRPPLSNGSSVAPRSSSGDTSRGFGFDVMRPSQELFVFRRPSTVEKATPFELHLQEIYTGQVEEDDGLNFFETHGYYDLCEANTVEMFRSNFGLEKFWTDNAKYQQEIDALAKLFEQNGVTLTNEDDRAMQQEQARLWQSQKHLRRRRRPLDAPEEQDLDSKRTSELSSSNQIEELDDDSDDQGSMQEDDQEDELEQEEEDEEAAAHRRKRELEEEQARKDFRLRQLTSEVDDEEIEMVRQEQQIVVHATTFIHMEQVRFEKFFVHVFHGENPSKCFEQFEKQNYFMPTMPLPMQPPPLALPPPLCQTAPLSASSSSASARGANAPAPVATPVAPASEPRQRWTSRSPLRGTLRAPSSPIAVPGASSLVAPLAMSSSSSNVAWGTTAACPPLSASQASSAGAGAFTVPSALANANRAGVTDALQGPSSLSTWPNNGAGSSVSAHPQPPPLSAPTNSLGWVTTQQPNVPLPPFSGYLYLFKDTIPHFLRMWHKRWLYLDFRSGIIQLFKRSYWKANRGRIDLQQVRQIRQLDKLRIVIEFYDEKRQPRMLFRSNSAQETELWVNLLQFAKKQVDRGANASNWAVVPSSGSSSSLASSSSGATSNISSSPPSSTWMSNVMRQIQLQQMQQLQQQHFDLYGPPSNCSAASATSTWNSSPPLSSTNATTNPGVFSNANATTTASATTASQHFLFRSKYQQTRVDVVSILIQHTSRNDISVA